MAGKSTEIRRKLRDLVDGRVSVREFQAWFVPATWELNEDGTATEELAAEIELRLAEFSNGHRTEDELIAILADLQVAAGRR
jgi:hypothetical protein